MRLTGITILALLQTIFSIQILFVGIGLVWSSMSLAKDADRLVSQYWVPVLMFAGVVLTVGAVGLLIAWGLFKLKQWAWLPAMAFQGLFLVFVAPNLLFSFVVPTFAGRLGLLVIMTIALSSGIIYSLLRPEVKHLFGR